MAKTFRLDLTNSEREVVEDALRALIETGKVSDTVPVADETAPSEQERCEVMISECLSGMLDLEPFDMELLVGALAEGLHTGLFKDDEEDWGDIAVGLLGKSLRSVILSTARSR